ncbi:GDP-mannose transporter [Nematocida displodere]|uniref:GDP-mannose transporter n=1 Tax=Nematocida displodere TaxID=1805483 RepID=A0A177EDQ7_9MICR|nr:GDP-mannose transporter [Nematocida displodere]
MLYIPKVGCVMTLAQLVSIVFISSSSMANTIMNKYLVSRAHVQSRFFVLAVQTTVILAVLLGMNVFVGEDLQTSFEFLKKWLVLSFSLIIMIYSGLQANVLPISLFTIFKNGSIPIIVIYDYLHKGYVIEELTGASFVFLVASSLLGSVSDVSDTDASDVSSGKAQTSVTKQKARVVGMVWMAINCISSACYAIRINILMKASGVSSVAAAIYINSLALPFLLILAAAEAFTFKIPTKHMPAICFSGLTSCAVSVSTTWAASIFTTTTLAMVMALNKTPMAMSGIVFGLERLGSPWKWVSVGLGLISATCYAVSKRH